MVRRKSQKSIETLVTDDGNDEPGEEHFGVLHFQALAVRL